MSISLVVLAAVLMGAPSAEAQERETKLWQVTQAHRMDAFKGELAPDFVAVYAHAINDAAAEVAAMDQQVLSGFELRDFQVRRLADTVELVTYVAAAKGTFKGSDISGEYRATSIWTSGEGGWKLAYHSEIKAD